MFGVVVIVERTLDLTSLIEPPETPHNLGLYRLEGFSGSRRQCSRCTTG